jgi:DNA-binding protein H-NS
MSKLTVSQSLALIQKEREALDKKEKALLSQHKGTALAQIVKIAHDNALSASDIVAALKDTKLLDLKSKPVLAKKASKLRGKVPPKYRNPSSPLQTWTGRGKMPSWVKVLKDNDTLASALIA